MLPEQLEEARIAYAEAIEATNDAAHASISEREASYFPGAAGQSRMREAGIRLIAARMAEMGAGRAFLAAFNEAMGTSS